MLLLLLLLHVLLSLLRMLMMLWHLILQLLLADASPADDPAVASNAFASPAPLYSLSFPLLYQLLFFAVSVSWLFVHLCWLIVHESWLCVQCASVLAFVPVFKMIYLL